MLLASFEPRRDRTPTGRRFVRKPTRHASSRQFESQPAETRGRYEQTLNAHPSIHQAVLARSLGDEALIESQTQIAGSVVRLVGRG